MKLTELERIVRRLSKMKSEYIYITGLRGRKLFVSDRYTIHEVCSDEELTLEDFPNYAIKMQDLKDVIKKCNEYIKPEIKFSKENNGYSINVVGKVDYGRKLPEISINLCYEAYSIFKDYYDEIHTPREFVGRLSKDDIKNYKKFTKYTHKDNFIFENVLLFQNKMLAYDGSTIQEQMLDSELKIDNPIPIKSKMIDKECNVRYSDHSVCFVFYNNNEACYYNTSFMKGFDIEFDNTLEFPFSIETNKKELRRKISKFNSKYFYVIFNEDESFDFYSSLGENYVSQFLKFDVEKFKKLIRRTNSLDITMGFDPVEGVVSLNKNLLSAIKE